MDNSKNSVARFDRLGLKEGLSEVNVTALLQDTRGFLWVGTNNGLNRYDGYEFSAYWHEPTDPDSLTGNQITAIYEDSQGFLWIGTRTGLNRYDRTTDRYRRYPFVADQDDASYGLRVTAIAEDPQGTLWVGTTEAGLLRVDGQSKQPTFYRHHRDSSFGLPDDHVSAVLKDSRGDLWVGMMGGGRGGSVCRLSQAGERLEVYGCEGQGSTDWSGGLITCLLEDSRGRLWVGTHGSGLYALEPRSAAVSFHCQHSPGSTPSLSNDRITCLAEDNRGNLWIGTQHGLNRLDVQTGQVRHYYRHDDDVHSLSHSEVTALISDVQGNLWVGTRTGLSRHDPTTLAFGHVRHYANAPTSLSGNVVTAVLMDSTETLWVGTYGDGLNKRVTVDPPSFAHYHHQADDPHSLMDLHTLPDDGIAHPLGQNAVTAIIEDTRGRLWFGTTAGLHRLAPDDTSDSSPVFIRHPHGGEHPNRLSHPCVRAICEDRAGCLWVGTFGGGVDVLAPDGETVVARYRYEPEAPSSLSDDKVFALFCDSRGEIWVGTDGGLDRVVMDGEATFTHYQHDRRDPHSISNSTVTAIAEDGAGNLWIGTVVGLNRFRPETEGFESFTVKDGLSGDLVDGLLVDGLGGIWVATNRGMDRFDLTTGRFTHFSAEDGLQSEESTMGAFHRDQRGRLYCGGVNGLNIFRADEIPENTYVPPVVLTGFRLSNEPVSVSESGPLKEPISVAKHIELAPEDYIFSFEFAALNYRQPHKNRFAYKLEGFDRDWIHTDARDRKSVYTNVPPGTYTFRVKASNDDGVWNEKGISIRVTVNEPWWRLVYKSAFEAVIIHDQGTILQANQAATEMFGYAQDELVGQSVYMLIPDEYHAQVARRIATGDETPYELPGRRKDGSIFEGEIRTRITPHMDRTVRVAAIRDIAERKRTEAGLRQAREFVQAALDSLSAHIAILDSEGVIVAVNASWRAFGEQNGLTWGDHGIGRNYLEATDAASHSGERDALKAAAGIRAVLAGERQQFWHEYPCHSPDTERWFEMRVSRFEDVDGVRTVIAHENVTERVKAMQGLQQSESKFRDFVEQSADGMFLVDEQGRVIEWNRSLVRITGLERDTVLGLHAWDVQYRLLVEEHRSQEAYEAYRASMTEALQTGQARWMEQTVRAAFKRTDNTVRHVEQRLFSIKSDIGYRIGGITTDVTDRVRAEDQLRTLSRAVEQSDSTIVVTDLHGTIEFVNPAFTETTGYTAEEALGQNPRILKSGEMAPEVYAELWRAITRGDVWVGELLNKKKNGDTYWETAIISPVRDGAGETTHYVAVKHDITARKQAEQALARQVRHEQALAACSQTLLEPGDGQPINRDVLNRALDHLREGVQASRAYVFQNFDDPEVGLCSRMVAEAVAPGLQRNLDDGFSRKIPWSEAPVENRLALAQGHSCGGPTAQLFASTPELLSVLLWNRILSMLFFPIHFGDSWWGYVAFDDSESERSWRAQEVAVLRTASQMVASALQRWQAEATLQESHQRLEVRVRARTAELREAIERLRAEITLREQAEAETRERLRIEETLAAISRQMLQTTELDRSLQEALSEIGALLDVDRVVFVRLPNNGQASPRVVEWCALDVSPLSGAADGWTLSQVYGWLEQVRSEGWFYSTHVPDIPDELRDTVSPVDRRAGESHYVVPVNTGDGLVGVLVLQGLTPFGDTFERYHQVLAVIVGILSSACAREDLIENLDARIAARTEELSTFFDLTTLAIRAQELSEMLDPIPHRILELGSCDAMCIHLLDADHTTLTLAAQANLPTTMRQQIQAVAIDSDFLERIQPLGEPLMLADQADSTPLAAALRLEGFPAYLGVPFPRGWVSYYRSSPRGFTLEESSLLLAVAEQIGVSVENYRLRQLMEQAVTTEERRRLGRDLHDSVTQSLYSLYLFARTGRDAVEDGDTPRLTRSLAQLENTSLQALREMRLLLYELRPEMLAQDGLIRTLERRLDAVERRSGMRAEVRYEGDDLALPRVVERELYYVTSEALNNALKHAGAQAVTVTVAQTASALRLEIADDGRGFDPDEGTKGYGLDSMRERLERLGGRLELLSSPGAGTRVIVDVDLVDV